MERELLFIFHVQKKCESGGIKIYFTLIILRNTRDIDLKDKKYWKILKMLDICFFNISYNSYNCAAHNPRC